MARSIEFVPEEKVAKAMGVFWKKGYTAASLSDLTRAMKINKSSLYNSIGDKHTLFKACLLAYGKLVEQDYTAAIQKGGSPLQQLDNIINKIVEITIERENSCMGVKTSFELASEDEEINAVVRSGNDKTINLIRSLVKAAQTSGLINPERDAEVMAHFIFNAFPGLRQSYILYKNKNLVKKMGNELKAYLRY